MKKIIIFFLFSSVPLSALVLKNDTRNAIQIISFKDARGADLYSLPDALQPCQVVQIPTQACLQHITITTQTDAQRQVFMVNMLAKDLPGLYNETAGLIFGIPGNRKEQRRYYKLQEKFPHQLNIRLQTISCMEKC